MLASNHTHDVRADRTSRGRQFRGPSTPKQKPLREACTGAGTTRTPIKKLRPTKATESTWTRRDRLRRSEKRARFSRPPSESFRASKFDAREKAQRRRLNGRRISVQSRRSRSIQFEAGLNLSNSRVLRTCPVCFFTIWRKSARGLESSEAVLPTVASLEVPSAGYVRPAEHQR